MLCGLHGLLSVYLGRLWLAVVRCDPVTLCPFARLAVVVPGIVAGRVPAVVVVVFLGCCDPSGRPRPTVTGLQAQTLETLGPSTA